MTPYRNHQVHSAFLKQVLYPYSLHDTLPQEVQVNFKHYENDYADYLFQKAQCYLLKGAAK